MKIAFDFICDEAPLFAEVGKLMLKEGYDVVGITLGKRWSKFWSNINVSPLDYDEKLNYEEKLQYINQKYGKYNPNSFILSDRFICEMSQTEQVSILVNTFLKAEEFFKREKPHIYFCTGIAYLYNLVTYAVCSELNIPHISLYATRSNIPKFTLSLGIWGNWDLINAIYDKNIENKNDINMLENFRKRKEKPFYMNFARQSTSFKMEFVKELLKRINYYYFDGWGYKKTDYITKNPFWYVFRDTKKIIRAKYFKFSREKTFDVLDTNEKYFLYPIHLQPEASTLIHAKWYLDQYNFIRNISGCLPIDTKLYVKEHISSFGRNTTEFYIKIKKLPNVKLIAPWENSYDLILNSKGLIVLTSTMGWEGILLKKPTFVFGDVFYNHINKINKLQNFPDLERYLLDAIKNPENFVVEDYKLENYLRAIDKGSFEGIFDVAKMDSYRRVMSPENIEKVHIGLKNIIKTALIM